MILGFGNGICSSNASNFSQGIAFLLLLLLLLLRWS